MPDDSISQNIEEYKKSPLFQKMLADAPALIEESKAFDERYAALIRQDHVTVGTILRCDLVVEHFLDEYLTAAHPAILELDSIRLNFAGKLQLA